MVYHLYKFEVPAFIRGVKNNALGITEMLHSFQQHLMTVDTAIRLFIGQNERELYDDCKEIELVLLDVLNLVEEASKQYDSVKATYEKLDAVQIKIDGILRNMDAKVMQ